MAYHFIWIYFLRTPILCIFPCSIRCFSSCQHIIQKGDFTSLLKDDRFTGLTMNGIRQDLIAGITVGIVAIPLGMAFAIASGVSPEYGLYTTVIAGLLVALLGGSRYQIAGPTGAFIPILLAIVLQYGFENLLIAGFLAGIMLVLMGIFKLGQLIQFIPRSVTIGFTSGIAAIIFTGQIGDFLGLEGLEKHEYFHENMIQLGQNILNFNIYSVFIAIFALALIMILSKVAPKVPVFLVALIIPTIGTALFFPNKVATIGTAFGGIPQSLPSFQSLHITWDKIILLWKPAFVIAMLGGIESLLSAVVSDGMTGKKHHSDRELIGQGIANMTVPFFGGIPATGAIARTATNIRSGAVSPLSGVFQSIFVLITILLFAPLASSIPLAAMAPILMVVAYNMSEYKSFFHILTLRSADSLVLVVTFLLTVFVNLTSAVQVGLLLAGVSFIKRMSDVLNIQKVTPDLAKQEGVSEEQYGVICEQISFYTVNGPLFFGAADRFESTITRTIHKHPKVLILKLTHVPFLDVTGASNLTSLVKKFKKNGGITLIAEANDAVIDMMKKTEVYHLIGKQHFFQHAEDAVDASLQMINVGDCSICAKKGRTSCKAFKTTEQLHAMKPLP